MELNSNLELENECQHQIPYHHKIKQKDQSQFDLSSNQNLVDKSIQIPNQHVNKTHNNNQSNFELSNNVSKNDNPIMQINNTIAKQQNQATQQNNYLARTNEIDHNLNIQDQSNSEVNSKFLCLQDKHNLITPNNKQKKIIEQSISSLNSTLYIKHEMFKHEILPFKQQKHKKLQNDSISLDSNQSKQQSFLQVPVQEKIAQDRDIQLSNRQIEKDISLNKILGQSEIQDSKNFKQIDQSNYFGNQSAIAQFQTPQHIKQKSINVDFQNNQQIISVEELIPQCHSKLFSLERLQIQNNYEEYFENNILNLSYDKLYKSQFELISEDLIDSFKRQTQIKYIQKQLNYDQYDQHKLDIIKYIHFVVLSCNPIFQHFVYQNFIDLIHSEIIKLSQTQRNDQQQTLFQFIKECMQIWGSICPKYFGFYLNELKNLQYAFINLAFISRSYLQKIITEQQRYCIIIQILNDKNVDCSNLVQEQEQLQLKIELINNLQEQQKYGLDLTQFLQQLKKLKYFISKYRINKISLNNLKYFLSDILQTQIQTEVNFTKDQIDNIYYFSSVFQYQLHLKQYNQELYQQVVVFLEFTFPFLLMDNKEVINFLNVTINCQKTKFIILYFLKEFFQISSQNIRKAILELFYLDLCEHYQRSKTHPEFYPNQKNQYDFNQLCYECINFWKSYYVKIDTKFRQTDYPDCFVSNQQTEIFNTMIQQFDEGIFQTYTETQTIFNSKLIAIIDQKDKSGLKNVVQDLQKNFTLMSTVKDITLQSNHSLQSMLGLFKKFLQNINLKSENLEEVKELIPNDEYFLPREVGNKRFLQINQNISDDQLEVNFKVINSENKKDIKRLSVLNKANHNRSNSISKQSYEMHSHNIDTMQKNTHERKSIWNCQNVYLHNLHQPQAPVSHLTARQSVVQARQSVQKSILKD